MRMVRLKKKLAAPAGVKGVKAEDLEFLLKVVEMGGGKTDIKGLAGELGMKVGAVNMRLVRLRKKFGRTGGSTGAGGSEWAEEVAMDEGGRVKQEEGVIEVKCEEGNW